MLFFAVQEKEKSPSTSFFSLYAGQFVKEEGKSGQQREQSAAAILRRLSGMSDEDFRLALKLPTLEEFHQIFKGGQRDLATVGAEYRMYLGELHRAMTEAVQNRAEPEIMDIYNKTDSWSCGIRTKQGPSWSREW